jgi:predicted dehydrogenase
MAQKKLRVAMVGCGQIADAHLQELRYVPSAQLAGVCDHHLDLARQAAARFQAPASYDDLGRMLAECKPDVVHVTTPPRTHKALALQALDAGAHVYVEKPFTVDAAEAKSVLHAAEACSRLVCVGHDQLFDPIWERVRGMVGRGELGRVIHVDSVQGYDLEGPFGRMLARDPNHWVLRLPGGLFQNTVSHALYRITDLLTDQQLQVWATWFRDPPDSPFPTELRVLLRGEQVTGHLLFSSRARPLQKVARIQGSRQSIEVDLDGQVIRRVHGARLPGAFGKIEIPFRQMQESARWLGRNLWRFLRSDIHYFGGMRRLFTAFYQAILTDSPPPIPYEEIHRVTALTDEIFEICQANDELCGIHQEFSSTPEFSWSIPQAAR